MTDLDKLLKGEKIYRHEDLREVSDKWNGWADFLQFGTLGLLLFSMFIFNSLPKATVKGFILYWAGIMFVLATLAFFVARKALKYRMAYLNAEGTRVGNLLDDAIVKVKEK